MESATSKPQGDLNKCRKVSDKNHHPFVINTVHESGREGSSLSPQRTRQKTHSKHHSEWCTKTERFSPNRDEDVLSTLPTSAQCWPHHRLRNRNVRHLSTSIGKEETKLSLMETWLFIQRFHSIANKLLKVSLIRLWHKKHKTEFYFYVLVTIRNGNC